MAKAHRHFAPRSRTALVHGAALAVLLIGSGCQNTLNAWRMGRDSSLSRGPTAEEVGDDRNLMARWLTPKVGSPTGAAAPRSPLVLGSNGWKPMKTAPNPEADAEFQAAQKLLEQGKVGEAESAFTRIAKNRKGTPWGEKSQFALAESQFRRGKYVKAHDSYETLVANYPGTQYLDKLVGREYEIAQIWLAQDDPKAKPETLIPWTGRFDGRRPLLDTNGNALQVLEHVRHHDVFGELADDALMQIADQHMASGAYEIAAMHYEQLTTDYAKSPFVQRAQLASIDARLKDYIGPEYDGEGLEKAREMVKQTMATFPDRPENNEKLYHTLDLINDQDAERTFVIAEYYKRTGKVASAEYYYGKLRHRYPKSPWAAKAKTQLALLAKMPRKESLPSKIMSAPGSIDSFNSSGGMGGMGGGMSPMGGMPGMGMGGSPGGMM